MARRPRRRRWIDPFCGRTTGRLGPEPPWVCPSSREGAVDGLAEGGGADASAFIEADGDAKLFIRANENEVLVGGVYQAGLSRVKLEAFALGINEKVFDLLKVAPVVDGLAVDAFDGELQPVVTDGT